MNKMKKINNKSLVLISAFLLIASTILIMMPINTQAQEGITIGTPQVPTTG